MTENKAHELSKFEDRITVVRANKQIYTLFPKSFQDLFYWEESDELYVFYVSRDDRVGLFHRPLRELEGDTISQLLKKLSIIPVMTPQEKGAVFSRANATRYILTYLKQKIPFIQMDARKPYCNETIIFTNKDGILMAKKAFEVSLEELVKNALEQNVIDMSIAKKLLKRDERIDYLDCFPDEEFTKMSLKYIDNIIEMKKEWEAVQDIVEEEAKYLEEVR